MMEFHVSKTARDKYEFDQALFSKNGNVIFANFQAAREFAHRMNLLREDPDDENTYIAPGQINALGLIDEIYHLIIQEYFITHGLGIRNDLYADLVSTLGEENIYDTLTTFNDQFPPVAVYQGEKTSAEYLSDSTDNTPNLQLALEEMLVNWLSNVNPAAEPYSELFNDSLLRKNTAYMRIIDGINIFFKRQPAVGPGSQDLITMLRTPAMVSPQSLSGQLEFIRANWTKYLGESLYRLLGSLDLIAEEQKAALVGTGPGAWGPGPTFVPDYTYDAWGEKLSEVENFSPDSDWMPKVVMIAKNSFVWLNQLSRQYQRQIDRLDQIPDETLDQLVRWGINGLWLIGLWERSEASREIKQMCGNPDAVSSAYSLARYQIAERLGGEQSYLDLSRRCGLRGIRLASDMVPNHMGIDSDWVYDHPDWFISAEESPFPSYTFDGAELSKRPDISIKLEDHYYTRSDAAVVFKRHDNNSGQTRFIYHGNDGTSMPWNDTAQLNYLNPEVREAVIQTILSVARQFPIIRFDAAMTLTKKHYQRLWFPQPGSGGAIPSRADYGLTREEFDTVMPEEFWREVVERVAREVPDTLLLAEAFWLMEGYFVRTLGMHRVYNSAFMHMLRNEENEKYRQLIKNTLVYDPEILKRYVNFMNNPDEETAVAQFGKGDKYFGICTLLTTMPGLPMLGHGQVEGYAEKYGMEYYRPYWDEIPDMDLVRKHESDIFPLVHRRKVFADVDQFRLYDFFKPDGAVDENVFAYSNYRDGQAALVVFNNRYQGTSGWIKTSVPFLVKTGSEGRLETRDLAESLALHGGTREFVIFYDYISKQYFIRSVQDIRDRGMFFSLDGYAHQALMDFKIVSGNEYEQLNQRLAGRGVRDLNNIIHEIEIEPALAPLKAILDCENLKELLSETDLDTYEKTGVQRALLAQNLAWLKQAADKLRGMYGVAGCGLEAAGEEARKLLNQVINLPGFGKANGFAASPLTASIAESIDGGLETDPRRLFVLAAWALLGNLAGPMSLPECAAASRRALTDSAIHPLIIQAFTSCGYSEYEAYKNTQALQWMISPLSLADLQMEDTPKSILAAWLKTDGVSPYLEVNEYNGVNWFNKEKFEDLLWYQQVIGLLRYSARERATRHGLVEKAIMQAEIITALNAAQESSGYQLEKLLSLLD